MKTTETIQQEMIADFVSGQSEITYFGTDSVARALIGAVANVQAEIWNDIYQSKRKMFIETAIGADLDLLASRFGITRRGATKSSVVLLFSGAVDTVIPEGTAVRSSLTNEVFRTQNAITLGRNAGIVPGHNSIGDIVIAVSDQTGTVSRVGARELSVVTAEIPGFTAVTNLLPSLGGEETENDTELRTRVLRSMSRDSQGTQEFYHYLCQNANNEVLRTKVYFDATTAGIKIYLLRNSLAVFDSGELTAIAGYVYDRHKALTPVVCLNAVQKSVNIAFTYTKEAGSDADEVYDGLATNLARYFEQKLQFGEVIRYSELIEVVVTTTGVFDLDVPSFRLNGTTRDIVATGIEVPRISTLDVTETETGAKSTTIDLLYLEL